MLDRRTFVAFEYADFESPPHDLGVRVTMLPDELLQLKTYLF